MSKMRVLARGRTTVAFTFSLLAHIYMRTLMMHRHAMKAASVVRP